MDRFHRQFRRGDLRRSCSAGRESRAVDILLAHPHRSIRLHRGATRKANGQQRNEDKTDVSAVCFYRRGSRAVSFRARGVGDSMATA
jgi:hypothetical protein